MGPILFHLFINDTECGITSSVSVFADDTKISRVINSHQDIKILQNDLNKIKGVGK